MSLTDKKKNKKIESARGNYTNEINVSRTPLGYKRI